MRLDQLIESYTSHQTDTTSQTRENKKTNKKETKEEIQFLNECSSKFPPPYPLPSMNVGTEEDYANPKYRPKFS